MGSARNQTGEVRHIDHQEGSDLVGDLAHAGEVKLTRIGAAAADDHLRLHLNSLGFELVVVDGLGVFANLVSGDVVELAGEVELVAVGEVAAVGEVQAENGFAGLQQCHVGGGVGPASRSAAAR